MVRTPPSCWCRWSAAWFCCSSSSESSSSAAGKPPVSIECQSSQTLRNRKQSRIPVGISVTSPSPCLSVHISVSLSLSLYLSCPCCLSLSLPVHQSVSASSHGSSSLAFPFFPCGVAGGIVTGRWQLPLISVFCAVCVGIHRERVLLFPSRGSQGHTEKWRLYARPRTCTCEPALNQSSCHTPKGEMSRFALL